MLKKITLFVALCGISPLLYGQETERENPLTFEGSYVGDGYYNAMGGIATGGGFMGMGNIMIGFDTEKAGWWKGGTFFINGASIHGKSLSENYLGDMQVASNIDAGEHAYMHELWYRQELGNVSFTLGLQDLNAEFMVSENAGEFINSSFGVPSVIAVNVPVPIFPLTGLGVTARWDIDDQFAVQGALFDGYQTPFENNNPYNLNWSFNKNDGLLAMAEFHARFNIGEKKGTYKIGAYYHSGLNELDETTQIMSPVFNNNYGIFLVADQIVFESDKRKVGLFAQLSVAPKQNNDNNYYVGLGANLFGVFGNRKNDALGFAVAHAGLHTLNSNETALELYYKYQINDNIAIQPDIQYIINPSGTNTLNNALVGMLRLHINF